MEHSRHFVIIIFISVVAFHLLTYTMYTIYKLFHMHTHTYCCNFVLILNRIKLQHFRSHSLICSFQLLYFTKLKVE